MNNLYSRSGKIQDKKPLPTEQTEEKEEGQEKLIHVNGFQQIVDMLRVAEPAFRRALLENIERQDPALAANLRQAVVTE